MILTTDYSPLTIPFVMPQPRLARSSHCYAIRFAMLRQDSSLLL